MVLNVIDFKKVFDSVHRPSVWKILKAYGIPSKILRTLTLLYDGSNSCVRVGAEYTERFRVDILFNVVLDFFLSKLSYIDGGIECSGSKRLKDLDYADDICMVIYNMDALKTMTRLVVEEASK